MNSYIILLVFIICSTTQQFISSEYFTNNNCQGRRFQQTIQRVQNCAPNGSRTIKITCTETHIIYQACDSKCQNCITPRKEPIGCDTRTTRLRLTCSRTPPIPKDDDNVSIVYEKDNKCETQSNLAEFINRGCINRIPTESSYVECDNNGNTKVTNYSQLECRGTSTNVVTYEVNKCYQNEGNGSFRVMRCRKVKTNPNITTSLFKIKSIEELLQKH